MEWLENTKTHNCTKYDGEVVISKFKQLNTIKVKFKFRKNCAWKIIATNEFMIVARDGNRIYFKESDSKKGFKLTSEGLNAKAFKLLAKRIDIRDEDYGEYNLEFDTNLHLHYIHLERKLDKQSLNWEEK